MIRFLENKEIDKKKWDHCIENSAQELPYGFSWYLDTVSENWAALVLNDYESVMPLPYKKKLGLKYIYQPFFTQQLGVFGNTENLSDKFIREIPEAFRHIHLNLNYKELSPLPENIKKQTNLILSLNESYENIKASFSENCRRNVKKSKSNLFHLDKCEAKDLIEIFRSNKGKDISHLKEANYKTLLKLISEFEKRNFCEINGIYDDHKKFYGGAVILNYKTRSIFFFSALTEEGKNKGAMYFLLDSLLEKKSGNSRLFDFEGSNNQSLARFYKGFGASEQNYFSYSVNRLPLAIKLFKK